MESTRQAGKTDPTKLILVGQGIMLDGALSNVIYNLFYVAEVPWAVVPITVYGFGMSTALPGMTGVALGVFPTLRGTASSVQSSVEVTVFALVAGFVAPWLYESALKLAFGTVGTALLCASLWHLSQRKVSR